MIPSSLLRLLPAVTLTLMLMLAPPLFAGQAVRIERQDPRLYGYQLGDVISEMVVIRLAPGLEFDPSSLPRAGKRAGWFMVRGSDVRAQPDSDGGTRIDLRLDMQLVNSPTQPRSLTIPAIALRFKGREPVSDTVPSLTIDAVPLGTGEIRTGLPDVRPAHAPPLIPTAQARQGLEGIEIAAAVLAGWLLLTLAVPLLRPRRLRPFAAAQRDLRRLLRGSASPDGARVAVQRLHRAFDEAAGQRLFAAGVPGFCRRLGADAELEQRTRDFFQASQTLFFATGEPPAPVPSGLGRELAALCRAWRRFEGRHP